MKYSNHILPRCFGLAAAFVLAFTQAPVFAQTSATAPARQPNTTQNANRMQTNGQAMHNRMEKRFNDLAQLLNLNPDQRTKAQAIFKQAWSSTQPLLTQLGQNREAIANLIQSNPPQAQFNTQLVKYSEREGNLVSQLVTVRTQAIEQFRNILNPTQQQKAADLYYLVTSQRPFEFETLGGPAHPMMSGMHNRMMNNGAGNTANK
jgi:Spy/CpxP family protein refolding chaperone